MHTLTHRKNNKERRKQVNEQTFLCFQKIFISFPSMMSKKHTKGKPSKPSSSFLPTKELCHPNKVSLANQERAAKIEKSLKTSEIFEEF